MQKDCRDSRIEYQMECSGSAVWKREGLRMQWGRESNFD